MTGSDKTVGTQMFVENINQYIKTKVVGIFYTSTMNIDQYSNPLNVSGYYVLNTTIKCWQSHKLRSPKRYKL